MKLSFEEWMRKVDQLVQSRVGLSAHDLPDWRYRDAYDDEMTPARAAAHVIKNAKDN